MLRTVSAADLLHCVLTNEPDVGGLVLTHTTVLAVVNNLNMFYKCESLNFISEAEKSRFPPPDRSNRAK